MVRARVGRRWRLRQLIVACAAVVSAAVALPAAAAGQAAGDTIAAYGVNDIRSDGILLPNAQYDGAADLNLLRDSGVRLYRARVRMDCVDPAGTGGFDFTGANRACSGLSYDALVGELARRGLTLLPVLMNFGPNGPLAPTGRDGAPPPERFAAFARAAAARYGPAGTFWAGCGCAPHPVRAWQIWNEQNNGWWWNGRASADEYAAVFAATRAALRSADPAARAVVGGLTYDPNGQPSFVAPREMIARLAAGNANAFDAVAVHPYSDIRGRTGAAAAGEARAFVDATAAAVAAATGPGPGGAPRQQLWVTEMGWSETDADGPTIAAAMQDFLGGLDAGGRAADNVGPVLWYMLRDGAYVGGRDDLLGLRRTTSTGADAGPKPVWSVFAAAAASAGDVALPPALADAAPYTPPPPAGRGGAGQARTAPASAPARPAGSSRRLVVRVRARSHHRGVRVTVSCGPGRRACSASVSLRASVARRATAGGKSARRAVRTVGARRVKVRPGRSASFTVALSRRGRSVLRHSPRLRVRVVVSARDRGGRKGRAAARATVRR